MRKVSIEIAKCNFTYRMMIKYGLVEEHPQEIKFYFEKINDRNRQNI